MIRRLQQIPKRMVTLCNAQIRWYSCLGRRWSKERRQTDSCGKGQASAERNRQFDWIREVLCNKAPMFTIRPVRSDRDVERIEPQQPCALMPALSSAPLPPTLRTDVLTGAMWPVLNRLNARCDLDKLVCGGFGAKLA